MPAICKTGNTIHKKGIREAAALLLSSCLLTLAPAAFGAESNINASASVGKPAPNFTLSDSNGKKHSLSESAGKVTVLEWINFDCPFVKKQYNSSIMQKLQKTYTDKGVVWFSICSSAEGRQGNYPPAKINELIKQNNATPTAYLLDPNGDVGHLYGAHATPHMFVINQKGTLVYAGAIDDNPSADIGEKQVTNYVQKAVDETLANKSVTVATSPAYGCSVKYKK